MPPEPKRPRRVHFMQTIALALELPIILVAGVLIGGGAGYWLDGKLGSSPLLTFLLGLVGFAAGVREILRRIPQDEPPDESDGKSDNGRDDGGE